MIFQSSYHLTTHVVKALAFPFNAEGHVGILLTPIMIVFGLSRPGIELKFAVVAANVSFFI